MSEYLTDEDLKRIEEWEPTDLHGLMKFIKKLWWPEDWRPGELGFMRESDTYTLSTGGQSGNECIISELQRKNGGKFWSLFWASSHRGGYHVFEMVE